MARFVLGFSFGDGLGVLFALDVEVGIHLSVVSSAFRTSFEAEASAGAFEGIAVVERVVSFGVEGGYFRVSFCDEDFVKGVDVRR